MTDAGSPVAGPSGTEPTGSAALEAPPRPRTSRGLVAGLVGGSLAAGAAGIALAVALAPLLLEWTLPRPAPAVSAAQAGVIEQALADRADLAAQLDAAAAEYRADAADWQSYLDGAEQWRALTAAPPEPVPNPGGDAMPGDDPTGRAFLDSIGAGSVSVSFDAGERNCGYAGASSPWMVAVGGCFSTQYPDTLFLAWDRGGEAAVWAIFVHEAMHWYQAEHGYELYLAVADARVDPAEWTAALEIDASCRAVFEHGIPIEDYESTSSPCSIGSEWHDGWLRDRAAALGAMVSAPDPESYEVLPEARP